MTGCFWMRARGRVFRLLIRVVEFVSSINILFSDDKSSAVILSTPWWYSSVIYDENLIASSRRACKLLKQFSFSVVSFGAPTTISVASRKLSKTWFMKHLHVSLLIDERAANLTHLLAQRLTAMLCFCCADFVSLLLRDEGKNLLCILTTPRMIHLIHRSKKCH